MVVANMIGGNSERIQSDSGAIMTGNSRSALRANGPIENAWSVSTIPESGRTNETALPGLRPTTAARRA